MKLALIVIGILLLLIILGAITVNYLSRRHREQYIKDLPESMLTKEE